MYDEIERLVQEVEEYSTHELRKVARQFDQDELFPHDQIKHLFGLNIFQLLVNYYLKGSHIVDFLNIIRIISQEFPAVGSILLTQASAGLIPIQSFGTIKQKEWLLDDIISGKRMVAFALGESESGSNIQNIRTTATETEAGWVLEGEKISVSNAPIADHFLVVAKIIDHQTKGGVGIFIVDRQMPGILVESPMLKMGIKALPVSTVSIHKVVLDPDRLLGNNRRAYDDVEFILNYQRLMIAAQSIGIAQGAMSRGIKYVTFDRRFGQRLIDLQNTQLRLAEVQSKIEAITAFLNSVVSESGLDTRKISMVKLMASDMAIETTETIMQVTGGYAYMRNNEIERFVRDAKVTAIYGGSSTTQKVIISQSWVAKKV